MAQSKQAKLAFETHLLTSWGMDTYDVTAQRDGEDIGVLELTINPDEGAIQDCNVEVKASERKQGVLSQLARHALNDMERRYKNLTSFRVDVENEKTLSVIRDVLSAAGFTLTYTDPLGREVSMEEALHLLQEEREKGDFADAPEIFDDTESPETRRLVAAVTVTGKRELHADTK